MSGTQDDDARHRGRARPRRTRWWLPLLVALLLGSAGQAAEAYWTATGTTSSSGVTGTGLPLVVAPGTPSAMLRPGSTADVVLVISNPNTDAVRVASLDLDEDQGTAGLSVDAAHSTCDTSSVSFVAQTTGWTVPGRSGTVDGTLAVSLPDSISMSASALNSCQGAQFAVHLDGS